MYVVASKSHSKDRKHIIKSTAFLLAGFSCNTYAAMPLAENSTHIYKNFEPLKEHSLLILPIRHSENIKYT